MRTLGLYLHIPFCLRKCRYCDFLSAPAGESVRESYTTELCRELAWAGGRIYRKTANSAENACYEPPAVDSVFFGGGTPSLLSGSQMTALMTVLRHCFELTPDAEITMECNPATVTKESLQVYREAGINRLSIGCQSAREEELRALGRLHSFEQFLDTWRLAREAGFQNCSIDLMCGLPGQTAERFSETLIPILKLSPEHLSIYSLIIEEGTMFANRYGTQQEHFKQLNHEESDWSEEEAPFEQKSAEALRSLPDLPSEDELVRIDELVHRVMEQAGYHRYEISNYAKSGYESRHNRKYWSMEEYLGLGLGASSYLQQDLAERLWKTLPVARETIWGVRAVQTRSLEDYLDCPKCDTSELSQAFAGRTEGQKTEGRNIRLPELELLDKRTAMEEFVFLGLRKTEGISVAEFEARFGIRFFSLYREPLERYLNQGFLTWEYDRIALTERGMEVSNPILADFLLD